MFFIKNLKNLLLNTISISLEDGANSSNGTSSPSGANPPLTKEQQDKLNELGNLLKELEEKLSRIKGEADFKGVMAKILRYYLEKDPERNSEDAKLTMDLFEEKLRKRLADLEIERRNLIEELDDLERKLRLLEESIQNNSNV